MDRPYRITNIDRTHNFVGLVIHEIECNVYYRGHVERMWLDVCDLGRTEVILGMPWLVAHNPEIDWEKGKMRMTRCPPMCRKRESNTRRWETRAKQKKSRKVEDKKAISWAADKKED